MPAAYPFNVNCFFVAWIFGWVTAVYVPSAVIALAGLSPLVRNDNLFSDVFAVADEVAPAAKLGFAILFASLVIATRGLGKAAGPVLTMVLAMVAMLVVIAVLPEAWSRGFGIGLAGARFALLPTAVYLGGGILSGLVFWISEARCRARSDRSGL